ncbi:hypothetical protein ACIBG8_20465 [Nonomuraea sp. NPDC050556]|uniref:hypothetical protein n=1 Tax=Nonomuraea sp. NPDC050556 TaxID=3364369 RepID=UPI00379CC1BA
MGKFDGMDPALVRDLLAEVKQAATQLRTLEGRIGQLMGGAGLATPATHRPVQVADACDTMVHDVTARLALLEKKEPVKDDQVVTPTSGGDDPKETRDGGRSPYDNPRDTTDPPKSTQDDPPKSTQDDPPKATHDDPPKSTQDDPPKATQDDPPKAVHDEQPKDADHDGRRDRGAEPDDQGIVDTPAKDHPDDIDQTGMKPRVVEVDGVKVLQVPLDPPTAEELADLLENIDAVQPVDLPVVTGDTTAADVSKWANDGSDVVSVNVTPPTAAELRTLIDHAREIQPLDMPDVKVPAGEWGKGDWAPQPIKPDGPPGSVDPGAANTRLDPPGSQTHDTTAGARTDTTAGGDAATATTAGGAGEVGQGRTGNVVDWANDGSDVVSVNVTPPTAAELRTLVDHARDIQPLDMPDVKVPAGEWGKGDWAPQPIKPDGPPGSVDPGAANTRLDPPGSQTHDTTAGARTDTTAGGDAATATTAGGAGEVGQGRTGNVVDWANDGSDVVSVNVTPPTAAELRTLVDHARDIQPLDMPDVKVPAGEWGKGDWAPQPIKPDGPPGSVDPGAANTRLDPPGTQTHDTTAGARTDTTAGGGAATVTTAGGAGEVGQGRTGNVVDWANDGSDVVTVNAKPPTAEALKTLMDHARDIEPMDMPDVRVPAGEWGKGEWVPEVIEPDGPAGQIEPGAPERSS